MNRNNEQHFALTPTANIARSKFERPKTVKTTWSEGQIVPIYCDQYVPGDTVKMKMSNVIRMTTPIVPVMDNAVCDVYFFNIPWRLIWNHTKQFVGENDTAPWAPTVEYEIPQIKAPEEGWNVGSLAEHLGEPIGVGNIKTSALKFRAYACVYNNWFRSEALQAPIYFNMGDELTIGSNKTDNWDEVRDTEKGGALLNACKTFDYFTSCLPNAQAGDPVSIPLSDHNLDVSMIDLSNNTRYDHVAFQNAWTQHVNGQGSTISSYSLIPHLGTVKKPSASTTSMDFSDSRGNYNNAKSTRDFENTGESWIDNQIPSGTYKLFSDLSQVTGATISALRQAYAVQVWQERAALNGQRFGEIIRGHFSVTNPDYRNMIPEYLGGFRTPITMNQVVQTSATDEVSPQGNTAAYSVTVDRKDDLFTRSFTEWGIILGVAVVRVANHSYQQGINREWTKKKKFDFYWPEFSNLSNQAVLNKELYADGTNEDEEAFGYQEAWAEMRFSQDEIHGELRDNAPQPLSIWQYADYYTERPRLSSEWIKEGKENIGKTLAVKTHDQMIGDFYFAPVWTRPMPVYSIPGLVSHA